MTEDSIAHIYDFILYPFITPIRKIILRFVEKYKYKKILDVCCGTGNQLKLLKSKGFDVYGVDLSDAMLRVAGKGLHAVNCSKEDAEAMSFENNSFDLVMTTFALHDKTTQSALSILKEMMRITKIEGHIIIVDFNIEDSVPVISRKVCTFIESLAGGEHYLNYKNYCKNGGIDYLINNLKLIGIERASTDKRAVTIRVLKKTDTSI